MLRKILAVIALAAFWAVPATAQTLGDHHVKGVYSNSSPYYNVKARTYQTSGQPLPGLDDATCSLGYDDQPEIQAAVDAMLADDIPGSVLFFPPGNYCIAERIVIGAHSNYKIMGDNATIIIDDLLNGASSGAAFSITSANELEISGLRIIDTNSTTHSGAEETHGIVIISSTNVDISNVYIEGMGDECIDIHTNSDNVTVRDSHFKDCAEVETDGTGLIGVSKSSNVRILNNFIENTSKATAAGIQLSCAGSACASDELHDILIQGNHIDNPAGTGILANPADGILSGLQIKDNLIRSPARSGIRIEGASGGTVVRTQITGNTIEGGGEAYTSAGGGIYVRAIASDGEGIISNNIVNAWGNTGDPADHIGIYSQSGGWIISNNTVKTARHAGIKSESSGDPNLIEGNHISTVSGSGIRAGNADIIRGNYVYGATNCIYFDAGIAGGQVTGNTVDTCSAIGVRLNGTPDTWAIGNYISNSLAGITPSGTSPSVAYNAFYNNTDDYGAGTTTVRLEIGEASTGDSATAFFAAGTLEHERGGLEADVSAYGGLVSIVSGATVEVALLSELDALFSGGLGGTYLTVDAEELVVDDVFIRNFESDAMDGTLTIDRTDGGGNQLTVRQDIAAGGVAAVVIDTTQNVDTTDYFPLAIREDSGGTPVDLLTVDSTGLLYARGGFSSAPVDVPANSLHDSSLLGDDKEAARWSADCTTLTDGGEVCDFDLWGMGGTTPGTLASVFSFDGSAGLITLAYPVNAPTLVAPILGTIASGVGTALTALNGSNVTTGQVPSGNIATTLVGKTLTSPEIDASASAVTSFKVPVNATTTGMNAAGQIAVDSSTGQFVYYGGGEKRVLSHQQTACGIWEDLTENDDNIPMGSKRRAIAVTHISCHCNGTCGGTIATIEFHDRSDTSVLNHAGGTAITCSSGTSNQTYTAVTSNGSLVAGEGLQFDVTNTPGTGDDYEVCYTFQTTAD